MVLGSGKSTSTMFKPLGYEHPEDKTRTGVLIYLKTQVESSTQISI